MSELSGHDELPAAAAWVLGALPEQEAVAYAEHLRGCSHCRAEVAELQSTADALALAAAPVDPPPELKSRIMDVVEHEAELLHAAGPEADLPPTRRRRPWRRPYRRHRHHWRRLVATRSALAGGCAALLIGVGAGVGVSSLTGSDGPESVTYQVSVASRLTGASGVLVRTGASAALRLQGMPAPPRGRVYQTWVVSGGGPPAPNAVFTVDRAGRASVALLGPLHGAETVLVTSEPAGGSQAPTSAPIIRVSST